MLKFREITPSFDLQKYVHSFWVLESSELVTEAETLRFVPDGNVEWMFHFDQPPSFQFLQKSQSYQFHNHVIGQFYGRLDIHLPAHSFRLFSIKFHPWSAHLFCNISMKELSDSLVSLEEIRAVRNWGLIDKINHSPSLDECVEISEKYLREHLPNDDINMLQTYYSTFQSAPEDIRFEFIRKKLPLSQRRLEQIFSSQIGLSPKKTYQIFKIRKAVRRMADLPQNSLTQLAYELGFYDQAHFTHQFKAFTGFSPKKFLNQSLSDSDLLYF